MHKAVEITTPVCELTGCLSSTKTSVHLRSERHALFESVTRQLQDFKKLNFVFMPDIKT